MFSIYQFRLRAILTAFGVFWGLFMLIMLLGAGKGVEGGFLKSFGGALSSSIWIRPSLTTVSYGGFPSGRPIVFSNSYFETSLMNIPCVENWGVEFDSGVKRFVSNRNRFGLFPIVGVSAEYFNVHGSLGKIKGRLLNNQDHLVGRKTVVIDVKVAERIFIKGQNPIGMYIEISDIKFLVVGLVKNSDESGGMASRIYLPGSSYRKVFSGLGEISSIIISPEITCDSQTTEKNVVAFIKRKYRISPLDTEALNVENAGKQASNTKQIFNYISSFIWVIGIGTLVAGTVSLSNIMMVSVKDRIQEIGIKKALGAPDISIVLPIVLEAIVITAVGGGLGLLIGRYMLSFINPAIEMLNGDGTYFSNPHVDSGVIYLSLTILILVGVIAGLIPALRAIRVSPVEAMRAK